MTSQKLEKDSQIRLVKVKHDFINGTGVSYSYNIQKRKKFLFLEWWQTVDCGYSDIQKAKIVAMSIISQAGQPKIQIISEF